MKVEYFMRLAIRQAEIAMDKGEVPVGAVISIDGKLISASHNMRCLQKRTSAHAEMLAIDSACSVLNSWRLEECNIYITMEPCPMCAGAIIQARIKNVYFGCYDKKSGAFGTVTDLSCFKWNHKPNIYGGILEEECSRLPKEFFKKIRKEE